MAKKEKSNCMGGMWVKDLEHGGQNEGIERGSELASDGREWNLSMIELGEKRQEPRGCQSDAVCVYICCSCHAALLAWGDCDGVIWLGPKNCLSSCVYTRR